MKRYIPFVDKLYECPLCEKDYKTKQRLKRHLESKSKKYSEEDTIHEEIIYLLEQLDMPSENDINTVCRYCDKDIETYSKLKYHERSICPVNPEHPNHKQMLFVLKNYEDSLTDFIDPDSLICPMCSNQSCNKYYYISHLKKEIENYSTVPKLQEMLSDLIQRVHITMSDFKQLNEMSIKLIDKHTFIIESDRDIITKRNPNGSLKITIKKKKIK
jgi:hypothetical protein